MSSPEHSPPPGPSEHPPRARANRRARLAAVAALIGSLVILILGLSVLAGDPVSVVLMFGLVFIVAFFAWLVLTRRSYLRLLGLPFMVFGVVGLFAFAYDHKVALPTLVVALVLFGFAARYAVRHAITAEQAVRLHARPADPARKGVLIINPKSGGGKAERFNLPEQARKRGVEPLLLERGHNLCELADRAVTQGADVIGMAGGDGSQALVARVAMQRDVAHICIPAGTRNHFALDLGLDRDDVVGALDAFTDGVERRIDLASLNERIFVNNASLGIYAQVVQSDAYRDGKLGTWRRMLPEMLGRDAGPCTFGFDAPDGRGWGDASLVIVSNNPYQLRRFRGAGTRPRLDTGRLGIFATRMRSAGAVAKLVTLGTIGQHRRLGDVLQWSSLEFEVRASAPVAVGLDGEALVLTPPLRFASLPGALRVRVPRHANGLSPAGVAVTLTRRNLWALMRIAAGKPTVVPSQR
jgi:diacylglycerol kinase family enzyme